MNSTAASLEIPQRILIRGTKATGKSTLALSFSLYCQRKKSRMKIVDIGRGAYALYMQVPKTRRRCIDYVNVDTWEKLEKELTEVDEKEHSVLVVDSPSNFVDLSHHYIRSRFSMGGRMEIKGEEFPVKVFEDFKFFEKNQRMARDLANQLIRQTLKRKFEYVVTTLSLLKHLDSGEFISMGPATQEVYSDVVIRTFKKREYASSSSPGYEYCALIESVRGKESGILVENPNYTKISEYLVVPKT